MVPRAGAEDGRAHEVHNCPSKTIKRSGRVHQRSCRARLGNVSETRGLSVIEDTDWQDRNDPILLEPLADPVREFRVLPNTPMRTAVTLYALMLRSAATLWYCGPNKSTLMSVSWLMLSCKTRDEQFKG